MNINKAVDIIVLKYLKYCVLIDMVCGFLNLYSSVAFSLGQFIRFPILLIVFYRIFTFHKFVYPKLFLLLLVLYLFSWLTFNVSYFQETGTLSDLILAIKPVTIFIFYFYVYKMIKEGKIVNCDVERIIDFNCKVVLVNQIVGLIGFGYLSYVNQIGVTGFYFAGNEYSILIVVLCAIKLRFLLAKNKRLNYVIWSVLFIGIALSTAIKTAILGVLILILFYPVVKNLKKLVFIGGITLLAVVFSWETIRSLNLAIIERLVWIYDNFGITTLIMSGRDYFLHDALRFFLEDYSFIHKFIGIGFFKLNELTKIPEMDFFDVLLMQGVFGIVFVYLPFLFILMRPILKGIFSRESDTRRVMIVCCLVVVISFIAGHVIFSASLAPFIGFLTLIESLEFEKPLVKINT